MKPCRRCNDADAVPAEKYCAKCKKEYLAECRKANEHDTVRTMSWSGNESKGRKYRGTRLIGHTQEDDEE